jgi:hypothetical protein
MNTPLMMFKTAWNWRYACPPFHPRCHVASTVDPQRKGGKDGNPYGAPCETVKQILNVLRACKIRKYIADEGPLEGDTAVTPPVRSSSSFEFPQRHLAGLPELRDNASRKVANSPELKCVSAATSRDAGD